MPTVNCKTCGIGFNKKTAQIKERKQHFCCHGHYSKFLKGKLPPNISGLIRDGSGRRGIKHIEESKKKISQSKMGSIPWNKGLVGVMPTVWNKGKEWFALRGENHPNWKGGAKTENLSIRQSVEYKKWRESVFERDSYTCRVCEVRGTYLNAHHILPFSKYPEHRLDINNGITLCKNCHNESKGREKWYAEEFVKLELLNWYIEDNFLR